MAAQVASAPAATSGKNPALSGGLNQERSSAAQGSGTALRAADGTRSVNNVEHHHHHHHHHLHHHHHTEPSAANPREKDGGNPASSAPNPGVDTGLLANHKMRMIGGGDPAAPQQQQQQQPPPPQQHARLMPSNSTNSSLAPGPREREGEGDARPHAGKDIALGNQVEQQILSKSEEEHRPCKPSERMGSGYEHELENSGPAGGARGNGAASDFNHHPPHPHHPAHYYSSARAGPCFDKHGGQQNPGVGIADPALNSHDGFHNSQYNQYGGYRAAFGSGGYGVMSSSRQGGNNMAMAPGSSAAGGLGKASMASASTSGGFQRFPGQSPHPSGATPTLNQLLTSPSPMMRGYGSGYQDYTPTAGQQPGVGKDVGSQYASGVHGWGAQQRSHPALSPGHGGQGVNRAQVPPMDFMAMKRSQLYGMGSSPFSQQQQGGPYPSQPYGSPPPHRYPMSIQGRGQVAMTSMQYPQQQQMPPQYGQQGGVGGYCQQGQQSYFGQPQQSTSQAPPPYGHTRAPTQQENQQEIYGNRTTQPPLTPGQPEHEEIGMIQQERPSSLPRVVNGVRGQQTRSSRH